MPRWCVAGAALMAMVVAMLAVPVVPAFAQSPPAPSASTLPAASNPTPPAAATPPAAPVATPPADPAATPPAATAPAPAVTPVVGNAHLPRDLSPWSMFMAADWMVKAVMLSLAFASVVTWTVWLAKTIELMLARGRLRSALAILSTQRTLADAQAQLKDSRGVLPALIAAAASELRLSSGVVDKAGIKERIASHFARIEVAAGRQMNRGTGLLATIGSTAPFVGLFGTVWGIMNSFIGISKAQTTNLAVVAPGIAEALLATAIGLFAAIPAVIIYNQFARWIAGYRALVGDASAEVQRLASRDLDRGTQPYPMARAAE